MDAGAPLRSKVFVVDDDDAVRDSIKILLEVHGLEVEDYPSAGEFARNYRKPARGCLILDQHLPRLTGIDFLNSPAGRALDIPVILITGRADRTLEARAERAGVFVFLQKPVSEQVLLAALARAIDGG